MKIKDQSSNGFVQELYPTDRDSVWHLPGTLSGSVHMNRQCQTFNIVYHTTSAPMRLHGKICKLTCVICMQTMHGKSAESHCTDTVHLFKDYYPNFTDI